MPASSIIVNGRETRSPNVYSQVDASSMVTNGFGATSLVLIGDAIGGKPASAFASSELPLLSVTTPDEVTSVFKSGDLREAGLIAFKASNDAKVPNSPQRVLFYKTNDSTQGSLTLSGIGASGVVDALAINSIDYGAHVNQVSFSLDAGSIGGLKATVKAQGVDDEIFDNIGAEEALKLSQDSNSFVDGFDNVASRATLIKGSGYKIVTPSDYNFDSNLAGIARTNAGVVTLHLKVDTVVAYDIPVTVYGLGATNEAVAWDATFTLGGSTTIDIDSTINRVTAVVVSEEFKGGMTLVADNAGQTVMTSLTGRVSNYLITNGEKLTLSVPALIDQIATIVGKNASGDTIQESILPTVVGADTNLEFAFVDSISFSAPLTQNLTIKKVDASTFTVIASSSSRWGDGGDMGLFGLSLLPVSDSNAVDKLTLTFAQPADTGFVVLRGKSYTGADASEVLAIPNNDTSVSSAMAWGSLSQIELLEFSSATGDPADVKPEVKISVESFNITHTNSTTLADLVVLLNGVDGLSAQTDIEGATLIASNILDQDTINISTALVGVGKLYSLNYDLEQALNSSSLVRGVSLNRVAPSQTASASLLTGGSDYGFNNGVLRTSTPTANFISAFTALQDVKNVIIVPMSEEESVHKALADHCKYMEGVGRDERNGYAPLPSNLDKSAVKARIRSLNSRNVSAVAQNVKAYNELGALSAYSSKVLAVIAGAMQAGSAIGMPLTNKIINCTEVNNDGDWSPSRNVEEMLEMGLMFARFDQERGVVWERSLTSWRTDSNSAFTEMSTNESVNVSTKLCRSSVQSRIGDRLFSGLSGVIKGLIAGELQRQIDNGIIKSFNPQSVVVQDIGDGFNVQYEIAPLEPVNFIKITAHIKRTPISA